MANAPFTQEQLDFLHKHFAKIPHDHSWDQIKDSSDGETLLDRVVETDSTLDEIEARLNELEGGEGEDEGEGEAE